MSNLNTIKKIFSSLCFALILASYSDAQILSTETNRDPEEYYFNKGDKAINLSVGLLNSSDFTFSIFKANGSGDPSPSIQLGYEYGLLDQISIAGFASFYTVETNTTFSYEELANQIASINLSDFGSIVNTLNCILNPSDCRSTVEERVNVYTLGAKLRYHQPILENLDTYASTYVGYSFNRRKTIVESVLQRAIGEVGLNTSIPTIVYFGSVGARYFISPKIGIWGEYGVGNVHLLNVGMTYRY